jgi:hypothetical protein
MTCSARTDPTSDRCAGQAEASGGPNKGAANSRASEIHRTAERIALVSAVVSKICPAPPPLVATSVAGETLSIGNIARS